MNLFKATKKKPENLEKLYISGARKAFSTMGLFVTKLRNRMKDDTLDTQFSCASTTRTCRKLSCDHTE